jgi:hypothetical protein
MTAVPLPASPCIRVRLEYTNADGSLAGSRFNLSYSGAAPTSGNCVTLAEDIATAWNSDLAEIVSGNWTLTEVDVLDIASDSGLFGTVSVSHEGSYSGAAIPSQVANNVEFDIGRRYRGGKPRMFIPPPSVGAQEDSAHWTSTFITLSNTQVTAFFTAVAALSVGSTGTLGHVNLSYYQGFKNVTNSSGRTRAAPTYRPLALLDPVTGYATKGVLGSQRRRRIATTP